MSIASLARQRGVRRLVHFTPARNLPRILLDGTVRPREALARDDTATSAFTDSLRLDGHRDKISVSLEYPNVYFLGAARRRARAYPDWIGLLLPVDLLDLDGVHLAATNAATRGALPASPKAFDAMYAETVIGARGRRLRRRTTHLDACPTDLQAEALIPGDVALSHVRGLLLPTESAARRVRAQLRQLQARVPDRVQWVVCSEAFEAGRLRDHVHAGHRPEEHQV